MRRSDSLRRVSKLCLLFCAVINLFYFPTRLLIIMHVSFCEFYPACGGSLLFFVVLEVILNVNYVRQSFTLDISMIIRCRGNMLLLFECPAYHLSVICCCLSVILNGSQCKQAEAKATRAGEQITEKWKHDLVIAFGQH